MSTTPRLELTLMAESQAGKYATFNDLVAAMDALCNCEVQDRDLTAPPASPTEGHCYLVAATATGAWAGHDGEIAQYYNAAWRFYPAPTKVWVIDEAVWT